MFENFKKFNLLQQKKTIIDSELEDNVIKIFKASRNNYGTRKIKKELAKLNYGVSRRRIGNIMKKYRLVSQYTVKQFKLHKTRCNEENVANVVNREFNREIIQPSYHISLSIFLLYFLLLNITFSSMNHLMEI